MALADQAVKEGTSIGSVDGDTEEVLSSVNVAPTSEQSFGEGSEERMGQVTLKISLYKILSATFLFGLA